MGKSIIISTSTSKFAEAEIKKIKDTLNIDDKNITDFITISALKGKSSVGIKQMQELKNWSKNKPYFSANKLAVIYTAELLTNEAQNSILKLLEEPNDSAHYILIASNPGKLLPTILSRCELIFDNSQSDKIIDISKFIEADQLDRFSYIQKLLKTSDSIEKQALIESFLISLLDYSRKKMLTLAKDENKVVELSNALKAVNVISTTHKMIAARVPAKSALDYLIVNVNID